MKFKYIIKSNKLIIYLIKFNNTKYYLNNFLNN